jgi:hypothetical protein
VQRARQPARPRADNQHIRFELFAFDVHAHREILSDLS